MELVVMVPGVVVTDVLSYDTEIAELDWKLLPVTVIILPGAPVVGFSDIAGVVAIAVVAVPDGELVPMELIADTR